MAGHKYIERTIGAYIGSRYRASAEIGVGNNFETALSILRSGGSVFCTDIGIPEETYGVAFYADDVFAPDDSLYQEVDLIYAVRPAEEMIPALLSLAKRAGCDLLVYHLGFEGFGNGGRIIDCGVILHQYYQA